MLEEKLKRASEETSQKTKHIVITAIAAISLGAIGLMAFTSNVSFLPSAAEGNLPRSDAGKQKAKTEDQTELRQRVLEKLREYKEELKPAIIASNLKEWDLKKDTEIASLEDAALKAFSYSEYVEAIKNLEKLEKSAKAVLINREEIFSSNIEAAKKALSEANYEKGKLFISQALIVKPGDQLGGDLEQKIDALPRILGLLREANIAKIENNLDKENALINEAFKLAPEREALKERVASLGLAIKERDFSSYIELSHESLSAKDLTQARSAYKKAQNIFPNRTELGVLLRGIATLERDKDIKNALSKANRAETGDDWPKAKALYQDALKRHLNDHRLLSGLKLSTTIVELKRTIEDYLKRQKRLSEPSISRLAKEVLARSEKFAKNSKSLVNAAARLSQALENMNRKIPVIVVSDSKTSVQVKGIGKVGMVSKKTIHLRPGEYLFEGARSGYKSKIVKVTILDGAHSATVEIRCDEPI